MAEFKIEDADLQSVQGSVVVLTGGSSGIGLATTELLLQLGASVVSGDLQPPKDDSAAAKHSAFTHVRCDVTQWNDQTALFSAAMDKHGRINHVFANAGVAPLPYEFGELKEVDGKLQEPKHPMLSINFMGQVHTVDLGVHYLSKNAEGGGIVANASAAGFSSMGLVDYTAGKHGMLGLVRGLASYLAGDRLGAGQDWTLPKVRVNALAPSWTDTNILSSELRSNPNFRMQGPEAVARCCVLQMVDTKRHGEIAFIQDGRCWEVQAGFREAMQKLIPGGESLEQQGRKVL